MNGVKESIKDFIKEINTIQLSDDEFLVVKLKEDASDEMLTDFQHVFSKVLGGRLKGRVLIIAWDGVEFTKVSKDNYKKGDLGLPESLGENSKCYVETQTTSKYMCKK